MIRPSELLLGYTDWKEFIKTTELTKDEKKWLIEWESYDLAVSPRDDHERRFIRYGHHLGWFDAVSKS